MSFLLPSYRGMSTYNNDETEIHVGLSSGEFYVLNLLLEKRGDNDDDGSSLPWWVLLIILPFGCKK